MSWERIGAELGISAQGAQQRYRTGITSVGDGGSSSCQAAATARPYFLAPRCRTAEVATSARQRARRAGRRACRTPTARRRATLRCRFRRRVARDFADGLREPGGAHHRRCIRHRPRHRHAPARGGRPRDHRGPGPSPGRRCRRLDRCRLRRAGCARPRTMANRERSPSRRPRTPRRGVPQCRRELPGARHRRRDPRDARPDRRDEPLRSRLWHSGVPRAAPGARRRDRRHGLDRGAPRLGSRPDLRHDQARRHRPRAQPRPAARRAGCEHQRGVPDRHRHPDGPRQHAVLRGGSGARPRVAAADGRGARGARVVGERRYGRGDRLPCRALPGSLVVPRSRRDGAAPRTGTRLEIGGARSRRWVCTNPRGHRTPAAGSGSFHAPDPGRVPVEFLHAAPRM